MVREQRRLAAVVSADVAGYSRLMGRDESGTLATLKALRREVVDPRIAAHGGRIVKTTGDGLLVEFPSVVDAVRCVVEVQTEMFARGATTPDDRRIAFRIGINLAISLPTTATSSATASISPRVCRRSRRSAGPAFRRVCTRTRATGSTSPSRTRGRAR